MSVRPGLKGGLRRIQGEIKIQQTFSLKLLGVQYRDKQIGYKNLTCLHYRQTRKTKPTKNSNHSKGGKTRNQNTPQGRKANKSKSLHKGRKTKTRKNETDLRN